MQAHTLIHCERTSGDKPWVGIPQIEATLETLLSCSQMISAFLPRCKARRPFQCWHDHQRWISVSTLEWQKGQSDETAPLDDLCIRSAVRMAPCMIQRKTGRRSTAVCSRTWRRALRSTVARSRISLLLCPAFKKLTWRMSSRKVWRQDKVCSRSSLLWFMIMLWKFCIMSTTSCAWTKAGRSCARRASMVMWSKEKTVPSRLWSSCQEIHFHPTTCKAFWKRAKKDSSGGAGNPEHKSKWSFTVFWNSRFVFTKRKRRDTCSCSKASGMEDLWIGLSKPRQTSKQRLVLVVSPASMFTRVRCMRWSTALFGSHAMAE